MFVVVMGSVLFAQQDVSLPGVVVEQNSKFNTGKVRYLSGTEIKASGNSTLSDSQGKFELGFTDTQVGNVVWIHAAKHDYELVNDEELKKSAVTGRTSPLKVVMCSQGQLYENQVAYYRIARDAKLEAYRKQMAVLKKEGKESKALIARLRSDFNTDIKDANAAKALLESQLVDEQKQAQELADKFVIVNLDDQSATYQRAFRAFLAQDIELAIRVMDSVDLAQRLARNEALINKISGIMDTLGVQKDTALRQIGMDVRQAVFSARLHETQYRFRETDSLYAMAMKYDRLDLDIAFEYARFLQKQNLFSKAKALYSDLESKCREQVAANRSEYSADLATALNNLGNLLSHLDERGLARHRFEESLEIRRKLAEKNPSADLPALAKTLNNLGALLQVNNEMQLAQIHYKRAVEIQKKLSDENPNVYLPELAATMHNLGILFKDINEMGLALEYSKEVLKIRRKLARENPEVYLSQLATTLNSHGNLLHKLKEVAPAKVYLEEAVQIYIKLAAKNPEAYLPFVAMSTLNLGNLHNTKHEMVLARSRYEDALGIYRKLAVGNPVVYSRYIAGTQNNLGALLLDLHDFAAARSCFEEALDLYRKCASQTPGVYMPYVAAILHNLGKLLHNLQEIEAARASFEEALGIYRNQAEKNPAVYLPSVANTLTTLGDLLRDLGEMAPARARHEEALLIRRKLAGNNPEVYLNDLAFSLRSISRLSSRQKLYDQGLVELKEAYNVRTQLVARDPLVFGLDACGDACLLATLYYQLLIGKGEQRYKTLGLALLDSAQTYLSVYPDPFPKVLRYSEYIEKTNRKFQVYGPSPHSKVVRQKELIRGYELRKQDTAHEPDFLYKIADAYGCLAMLQLFAEDFLAAEASARNGLQLAPGQTWIHTNLALALLYQGKWLEAKEIYLRLVDEPYADATYRETFLEDLDALEAVGIRHSEVEKARRLLK